MLKELFKNGNSRYFEGEKEGKKVFIKVYEYSLKHTLEEIEKAFINADIPSYLKPKYTIESILNEPLNNLFQLDIHSSSQVLQPNNFNLYEYERLIKGNNKPSNALKSACICDDREKKYFYIICEPYDESSALTKGNINIISDYISIHVKEFEDILKVNYSHTEMY